MIKLNDVLDTAHLDEMIQNKYVKIQTHPKFPELSIANYTDSCMWDQMWNDTTLNCRGLIFNNQTMEVLARPFRKFFNYEQEQAPKWDLDTKLHVTDKLDGSLGILYRQPDGNYAVATRGSFNSDQAQWANEVYEALHASLWEPNPKYTYLYELIYPENRIVVNYEGMQALILLGAVDIETGESIPVEDIAVDWPGFIVPIFHDEATLKEILESPARENAEGVVMWNRETDERVKIKYEDYKILHRYLTNTTPKHVWEVLSAGQDPDEIFAAAPDEFHVWLKDVIEELQEKFLAIKMEAETDFKQITRNMSPSTTRKDFADKAQYARHTSMMFKMYDRQPVDEAIWRMIKPSGVRTVRTVNSDAD